MEDFLTVLLIGIAIISIIPVINLNKSYRDKKYLCLKYLINITFFWTILVFIKLLVENITVLYFAHMLTFPIKFLLASLMVCTLFSYIEKQISRNFKRIFFVFLAIEIILSLSNPWTGFFINASISDVSSLNDLVNAEYGIFFIYHLLVSYAILVIGVIYILIYLSKNKNIRQYKEITYTMVFSVFIVLLFNALQLFVIESTIDFTYVSLVIVSYLLYRVIFKRDMIFNLKTSGRGEILSNMREMYILTDRDKHIVEISNLLIERYGVSEDEFIGKKLNQLIDYLMDKIVFYSDYDLDQDEDIEKDHFHLREKQFKLKGMNDYGYMILLYDQTKVINLLRELNRLSNYDTMTGLHNRNFIEKKLDTIQAGKNIGVISLDLNGLKVNNDYLGHERGDFLLKSLANKIKTLTNKNDDIHTARVGGDEFLIIIEKSEESKVKQLGKEILNRCEDQSIDKKISVSIGISYSKKEEDIYKLIRWADDRMYEMKRATSKDYKERIVEYAKKKNKYIR